MKDGIFQLQLSCISKATQLGIANGEKKKPPATTAKGKQELEFIMMSPGTRSNAPAKAD